MDYKAIQSWLEKRGFAFNRPFRSNGDAYTYGGQFLGYHERDEMDYFRCVEKWLAVELGVHWYRILRDKHDLSWLGDMERKDIETAWKWWNDIASESEK